jgi:hypothetical protein
MAANTEPISWRSALAPLPLGATVARSPRQASGGGGEGQRFPLVDPSEAMADAEPTQQSTTPQTTERTSRNTPTTSISIRMPLWVSRLI